MAVTTRAAAKKAVAAVTRVTRAMAANATEATATGARERTTRASRRRGAQAAANSLAPPARRPRPARVVAGAHTEPGTPSVSLALGLGREAEPAVSEDAEMVDAPGRSREAEPEDKMAEDEAMEDVVRDSSAPLSGGPRPVRAVSGAHTEPTTPLTSAFEQGRHTIKTELLELGVNQRTAEGIAVAATSRKGSSPAQSLNRVVGRRVQKRQGNASPAAQAGTRKEGRVVTRKAPAAAAKAPAQAEPAREPASGSQKREGVTSLEVPDRFAEAMTSYLQQLLDAEAGPVGPAASQAEARDGKDVIVEGAYELGASEPEASAPTGADAGGDLEAEGLEEQSGAVEEEVVVEDYASDWSANSLDPFEDGETTMLFQEEFARQREESEEEARVVAQREYDGDSVDSEEGFFGREGAEFPSYVRGSSEEEEEEDDDDDNEDEGEEDVSVTERGFRAWLSGLASHPFPRWAAAPRRPTPPSSSSSSSPLPPPSPPPPPPAGARPDVDDADDTMFSLFNER